MKKDYKERRAYGRGETVQGKPYKAEQAIDPAELEYLLEKGRKLRQRVHKSFEPLFNIPPEMWDMRLRYSGV